MDTLIDNDWDVEKNGITRERALELEGVPDYPRISAARFHFTRLTPEERARVLAIARRELTEAKEYAKSLRKQAAEGYSKIREEVSKGIEYGGQKSMLKPYYAGLRKQAQRLIEIAERNLASLEAQS